MKCQKCGAGWPTVKVETYVGGPTSVALCDDCLSAECDQTPTTAPLCWPGAQVFVWPNGSETALPSYES